MRLKSHAFRSAFSSVVGRRGRWSVAPLVVALLAGLIVAVAPAVTTLAPARAASAPHPAGTGGLFVPATGVLLDTTKGTGGFSTPMPAGTVRHIQVEGAAGLPASGVAAVEVTLVSQNAAGQGVLSGAGDGFTQQSLMVYDSAGLQYQSNAAIIPVGDDGKIYFAAQVQTDLIVDLQGYYTAGNGITAAGGYVPMNQVRILDTRTGIGLPVAKLSGGHTYTIAAAGSHGIPVGAQAIFIDLTVRNYSGTAAAIDAFSSDDAVMPPGYMWFPYTDQATPETVAVPIGADGKFRVYVSGSVSIDLFGDVEGYWTAGSSAGSFTPATGRLLDTRTTTPLHVAADSKVKVQVEGAAKIPPVGSGISAITYSLTVIDGGSGGGAAIAWPDGTTMPAVDNLNYRNDIRSSLQTTKLGSNGAIDVYNGSTDTVDFTIDVQGWYTSAGGAIANGQNQTLQAVTLQGSDVGGGSWVTYQYRLGSTGTFSNVPVGDVTVPGTTTNPAAWPVQSSSGTFAPYTWNVAGTLGGTAALVQVQACYGTTSSATGAALTCSAPQNLSYSPGDFGEAYATASLGPGSLSLLTGDYEVAATDADVSTSLGGLSIGRSLTTLIPAGASTSASGVFGPGWTADLSGPDTGDATLNPTDQSAKGYILFTSTDGSSSAYEETGTSTAYPQTFVGVGANTADGVTVSKANASTIAMTDPDGTVTTWSSSSGAWLVSSVAQPGSNTATTFTYSGALVTRILAPVPAGISCTSPDTTPGCRSLLLGYTSLATPTGTVSRLSTVTLSDPQTAGTASRTVVEQYGYDPNGKLTAAWDPRLSPPLKTAYSYDSAGRLVTLTPPGQATWQIGYDSTNRVASLARQDPSGQAAIQDVVYKVPFTGTGAPVELGAAKASSWGESTDLPMTGTAIFPATHQPSAQTAAAVNTTDWPYATIHYLDVNGREVNSAEYGAGQWLVDTTQYDANGNDVWDLSAGNRAQALSPTTATDPYVAALSSSTDRANLLATTNVYDPETPSELTDTYGPTHPVTLANGTVIDAEDHTETTYDENAPAADASDGLATTVTVNEWNAATGKNTVYPDARVTRYGYAAVGSMSTAGTGGTPVTGWDLHEPTTTTVQMGATTSASDLVSTTLYDAQGRTIATSLPANTATTGPQTQVTSYYTATGTGTCVSATSAGLTCQTAPASQPTSGNPLPVTTYKYNADGLPITKTETAASTERTTSITYDAADRLATRQETISPATGAALSKVTYSYDADTGLPASASTGAAPTGQTITMGYNPLGQQTSYTDANGQTTNTSYDLNGNPSTVTSPVGTTSYSYDSASEHRGMVTSEDIHVSGSPSTFQASYDADGNLQTETYPNGLAATTSHDNAGNAIALNYAKSSTTWMSFTNTIGLGGNIVAQTSPGDAQTYTFDGDGRLTQSNDTVTPSSGSAQCTTSSYSFDADSNRTSLTTSTPAASCGSGQTASTTTGTFDTADRITNTGYTYDALGRTTTVPAADARSSTAFPGATGNLTLGYYANDMAATEQQGSWSMSYTLDPVQNRINTATATTGTTSTQTINDYSDNSDSPAWSTIGSNWTRNVTGPDSMLDASVNQAGSVTLDLTDLEGSEVATAADSTSDTGIDSNSYASYGIYGTPTSGSAATSNAGYGWEGGNQRSADSLGGLILMGARLYDTLTGRFLSVDPVYQGNANPYIYPANPINDNDLSGRLSAHMKSLFRGWARSFQILQAIVDGIAFFASFIPGGAPIIDALALAITAITVLTTCIGYGWRSGDCREGMMLSLLALIGPAISFAGRMLKWGHAGFRLAERYKRLNSEVSFVVDIYGLLRLYVR